MTTAGDRACPADTEADGSAYPDMLAVTLSFDCGPGTSGRLVYGLFLDIDPAHRAAGQAVYPGGAREDILFDAAFREIDLAAHSAGMAANPPDRWGSFPGIVRLGITHILSGADHVLFVLLLILGTRKLRGAVAVVTAFTLGHSLTLALSWFDILTLPPAPGGTADRRVRRHCRPGPGGAAGRPARRLDDGRRVWPAAWSWLRRGAAGGGAWRDVRLRPAGRVQSGCRDRPADRGDTGAGVC